jgi:hypothetical protein
MPKFTFPINVDKLRKVLSTPESAEALRAFNTEDNVSYAIGCMRAGYINKMHHKEKQLEDQGLRELLKSDPKLKAQLQARAAATTASTKKTG